LSCKLFPITALAALVACSPTTTTAPTITAMSGPIVGVLEERLGTNTEEPTRFVMRAAFHKEGDAWRAYDHECSDQACLTAAVVRVPQETSWTVALHGQRLAEISARTPAAWTRYADVGQQELSAGAAAPTSGARSMDFAGQLGAAVYRPLVATSPGSFSDPQAWAAATLPAATVQALRQSFRAKFAVVVDCASAVAPPRPRTYRDDDIDVSQTHASTTQWRIATLHLTGYRCDGPLEEAYADQVFAVSPAGEVRHLGEWLKFVDAGDYDADGQSEVVFAITGANQGGYQLFANDFAQNAVFGYGYH
jgi:hypothetical protein